MADPKGWQAFKGLDPEIRCFALVGEFLRAWSLMEASLHDAIGAALNIEGLKVRILCANMRSRDKLHVIASLVYVADSFSYEERSEIRKKLRTLADYSANRNMMAHDPFGPAESKTGVKFLTVKAKGKVDIPDVVWSVEKFRTESEFVHDYSDFFDGLTARFKARPLAPPDYVSALMPFVMANSDDLVDD
jgi:hypothetical protein